MAKISDMMIRKLAGEKGKTQKITIGAGLQLHITPCEGCQYHGIRL